MPVECLDKAQKTGVKANEENPKIGATQEKGTRNEGCCVIAGLSKRWGMRGWKHKGQKGHRPDGPPTTLWFLFEDEDEATYSRAFAIQCNGSLSRNGSGLGLGTS